MFTKKLPLTSPTNTNFYTSCRCSCWSVLVIVLALGMTVAGCGGSVTTFTLTDIPSKYDGKYARAGFLGGNGNLTLTGAQNITETTVTLPQISDGKVIIPLWQMSSSRITSYIRYKGNGSFTLGSVNLYDTGNDNDKNRTAIANIALMDITISNGNAAKSWNDALMVTEY